MKNPTQSCLYCCLLYSIRVFDFLLPQRFLLHQSPACRAKIWECHTRRDLDCSLEWRKLFHVWPRPPPRCTVVCSWEWKLGPASSSHSEIATSLSAHGAQCESGCVYMQPCLIEEQIAGDRSHHVLSPWPPLRLVSQSPLSPPSLFCGPSPVRIPLLPPWISQTAFNDLLFLPAGDKGHYGSLEGVLPGPECVWVEKTTVTARSHNCPLS